jgi:long-chain acyl-CoA synthetase
LPLKSPEELVNDALLKSKIEKEIQHINQRFGQWEQVKKFVLIPRPFSIEGGELTPTLKLRRKNLYTNYAAEIESMYAKS